MKDSMHRFLFITFLMATIDCFSQTEFLDKLEKVEFGNVDYEIMQTNGFNTFEVFVKEGDSLILVESSVLNFNDSTIISEIYTQKKRKFQSGRLI